MRDYKPAIEVGNLPAPYSPFSGWIVWRSYKFVALLSGVFQPTWRFERFKDNQVNSSTLNSKQSGMTFAVAFLLGLSIFVGVTEATLRWHVMPNDSYAGYKNSFGQVWRRPQLSVILMWPTH